MIDLAARLDVEAPKNVLANRYASPEIVALFTDESRVYAERGLWIEIMRKQAELGLDIPAEHIDDYQAVRGFINLDSILKREKTSGHDVNARLEEFNDLAGHQHIQKGMTSRDLTENIEQAQFLQAMKLIEIRVAATLVRFALRAGEYATTPMSGRSHNVPAQTITLGKRFANFGSELIDGYDRLHHLQKGYMLRGIKGPVGTQQDMLDLFEGDEEKVDALEDHVADVLGFWVVQNSVGQVYPRSSDFDIVTALKQLTAGPANFALTLRLMAGQDLATEGFKPGQVGSNAMPHKMNANKSERIASLSALLTGNVASAAEVSSRQWNEGDVSCSAARRVYMPDAFYATDGILQTTMTILDGMGAYPAVIDAELQKYLPFLVTTKALMAAVKAGVGRETAHNIIKEHAVKVALEMREEGSQKNDLIDRLVNDPRLPISSDSFGNALTKPLSLTGLADRQVSRFIHLAENVVMNHPEAMTYKPSTVL